MNLKIKIKRDAKILRQKTLLKGKKLKKNLPKFRKKAIKRANLIQRYFDEGINPKNFKLT